MIWHDCRRCCSGLWRHRYRDGRRGRNRPSALSIHAVRFRVTACGGYLKRTRPASLLFCCRPSRGRRGRGG